MNAPEVKWVGTDKDYYPLRKGYPVKLFSLHTMEGTLVGTDAWFNNAKVDVSAHFGVGKKGQLHQYVKLEDGAWANGTVREPLIPLPYPPNVNPNLYTVSIEFEGKSGEPLTEEQYQAGLALIRWLLWRFPQNDGRPIEHIVVGHSQINSVDKPNCPGPAFPWERLYKDLKPQQGPGVLIAETGEFFEGIMHEGRMYTPVRAPFEALGHKVEYNGTTKIATIHK